MDAAGRQRTQQEVGRSNRDDHHRRAGAVAPEPGACTSTREEPVDFGRHDGPPVAPWRRNSSTTARRTGTARTRSRAPQWTASFAAVPGQSAASPRRCAWTIHVEKVVDVPERPAPRTSNGPPLTRAPVRTPSRKPPLRFTRNVPAGKL